MVGGANVHGKTKVYGDAKICGRAMVCGDVKICGKALLCNNAEISGSCTITDTSDYFVIAPIGSENTIIKYNLKSPFEFPFLVDASMEH